MKTDFTCGIAQVFKTTRVFVGLFDSVNFKKKKKKRHPLLDLKDVCGFLLLPQSSWVKFAEVPTF